MTQAKKRAVYTILIWCSVMVFFSIIFILGGGTAEYVQDSVRHASVALIFAVGYALFFLMLYLTREKIADEHKITDERDEEIEKRANGAALILVLLYIFLFSISLFIAYEDEEVMPVGWMWFLAYSSAFCGYISHALATLILNYEMER